jgi:hypothetical protein
VLPWMKSAIATVACASGEIRAHVVPLKMFA